MTTDSMRLVQALIGASSKDHASKEAEVPHGPVVTISRRYGSGGRRTGVALAQRLGVRLFDKEILEHVAEKAKVDKWLMEELDEHVRGAMSDWVHTLIVGKSVYSEDYRRHLMSIVLGIAQTGGVIVGRGAHLILAERKEVFKVRITAKEPFCVRTIMDREGISEKDALKAVRDRNHDMEHFLQNLYHQKGNADYDFDMVLSAERYHTDQMVDMILAGMEKAGIEVPGKKGH